MRNLNIIMYNMIWQIKWNSSIFYIVWDHKSQNSSYELSQVFCIVTHHHAEIYFICFIISSGKSVGMKWILKMEGNTIPCVHSIHVRRWSIFGYNFKIYIKHEKRNMANAVSDSLDMQIWTKSRRTHKHTPSH